MKTFQAIIIFIKEIFSAIEKMRNFISYYKSKKKERLLEEKEQEKSSAKIDYAISTEDLDKLNDLAGWKD